MKRKERDEDGRVVNEQDIKAHRNQWEVSRDQHGLTGLSFDEIWRSEKDYY